MKVLFLTRRFYPEIGGVERHVLEVGKRLVKKGYRVVVIAENPQKTHSDTKQLSSKSAKMAGNVEGVEIHRIDAGKDDWFKKFRIWKELWGLAKLISDADIVHCHDVFFWYLPFRFLFPKKKVYTTFHGYEGYPIRNRRVIVRKISEKLSWGNICIGRFIEKYYKTEANFVLYGGVDIPKTIIQYTNKLSGVFIGRLSVTMGIKTYLKVFEILSEKGFRFSIVGDGEYRNKIDKKFKVGGFKEDTSEYFQRNHFAFVSGYLSILEAMANKRLVISVYENPLRKDYLEMTPFADFIVIENDSGKIADKIQYFLDNPKEEDKIVSKAFEWVKTQTWDNVVKAYLDLWS